MDKVLVVHPDLEVRQDVVFTLEQAGFEVISASDGREAVAKAYDSNPDLIVLAEYLPPMNANLPWLRIRQTSDVPIIILGVDEREWAGIEFLESGADVYMTCPLNLRELIAWVHSLLRRAKGELYGT